MKLGSIIGTGVFINSVTF